MIILKPEKNDVLMTVKELAEHTGIPIPVIYAARSAGMPFPGRQATPNELNAWLAKGVQRNTDGIDYYDALRYPCELIVAAKCSRSYYFAAVRAGFPRDESKRSTVRAFRAFLVAHPDFRCDPYFNRKNPKGRTLEECGNLAKLPTSDRLKIDKSKWRIRTPAKCLEQR